MKTIDPANSILLVIDFQSRLMPAIHDGEKAVTETRRLLDAATLLDIPLLFTEQNAKGLGGTVESLAPAPDLIAHKMSFDACRAPGFLDRLPEGKSLVVAGCEAHVCVQQTVLGLLDAGRKVYLVRDAIGSRKAESKVTAIARMAKHGAEIVTAEMVIFEWLVTCEHPKFREGVKLVK